MLASTRPNVLDIETIKKRIAPVASQYGIESVYLFGSYARGEATKDSDVDLCICKGKQICTLLDLSGLYLEMEELLGKPIDLITTEGLRTSRREKFKKNIETEMIKIYGENVMENKDRQILEYVVTYCNDIDETRQRFGNFGVFEIDKDYYNSVCMCFLQIGELVNHLSESFTQQHSTIPWRKIIALRNIVVHGYDSLDKPAIWGMLDKDIPRLSAYCNEILELEPSL